MNNCRENIPMFKVAMNPNVEKRLLEVLHSGWIGQGTEVNNFEEKLGRYFENPYVLTLSSGTHGLTLALRLSDIEPGDEVITTPLTCQATVMPILQQGAKIVWADIRKDLNIDWASIAEKVTHKTKAIIMVHWGGYPCDMVEIAQISADHGNNISIIEDAAHSFGSTYKNHKIGECWNSNYCMMSFQAIKHLTTVDGGALFCSEGNADDYHRGKLLRWYGIDREGPRKDMRCALDNQVKEWGYKFHMNDVCATIGMENFDIARLNVSEARDNAGFYERELSDVDGIELTQIQNDRESSYWLFTVLVDDRTSFAHMMGSRNISVSRVHERVDKHAFAKEFECDLPMLEEVIDKMICIPVGWWLSREDREYIVSCIKEGW